MRTIIITMISIVLLAISGTAQQTSTEKSLKKSSEKQTKIYTDLVKVVRGQPFSLEKVVKNKPYSIEAVSESIQVLQDGNRITRSTSVKLFRDGEGRTRREGNGAAGNPFNSDISGFGSAAFSLGVSNTISIIDPVNSVRYILYPETKTVRRYDNQNPSGTMKIMTNNSTSPVETDVRKFYEMTAEERAEMEKKVVELNKKFTKPDRELSNVVVMGNVVTLFFDKTKPESLGTKTIEGVEAEGTRTVKTIEAGAIGNELPIEITYEKWYSKDLDLIVYSRKYDPRSGEQIYRLTNISQTEPDGSLFTVPSDYKIVDTKSVEFKTLVKPDNLFEN